LEKLPSFSTYLISSIINVIIGAEDTTGIARFFCINVVTYAHLTCSMMNIETS